MLSLAAPYDAHAAPPRPNRACLVPGVCLGAGIRRPSGGLRDGGIVIVGHEP